MSNQQKPPVWFWIVSVLALLWNLTGVYMYLDQAYASDTLGEIAKAAEDLIDPTPAWVTAAFAIAVFGGAIGCLLLLLRKALAFTLLVVSFLGVVAQNIYYLMNGETMDAGPGGLSMVVMVVAFSVGLVFFSKKAKSAGWIS